MRAPGTRPGDRPARLRPRTVTAAVAVALGTCGLAGCGLSGGTASLGPTTTQAVPSAKLRIEPPEGPIGTVFTLSADGMTAGAAVQFEITFPGEGRAYPGNALVVAEDGTASATYRATSTNVPGTYTVRLTGPLGQLATGEFRVTDGKPLLPAGTSSTRPGSSTTKGTAGGHGTTTSTGRATSTAPSSTARSTTTTTRPAPTTAPPTSPPTAPPTTPPPTRG